MIEAKHDRNARADAAAAENRARDAEVLHHPTTSNAMFLRS